MHFLLLLLALTTLTTSPSLAQDDFAVPPAPHMEDYYVSGLAPTRSDPGADVTIIYFSDYQCPACRRHTPDVNAVFASDRKLKIIYRDTPIFGPRSEEAARYAIASQYQGKHEPFHRALMAQPLPLDDAAIQAAAAKAGVDWARLQKDRAAHAKAIDAQIAQNQNLSEAAGISGTPAFIIGKTLANGALDAQGLRAEIADARAAAPSKAAQPTAPAKATIPEPAEVDLPVANEAEAEAVAPVNEPSASPAATAPMFEPARPPAATQSNQADWHLPAIVGGILAALAAFILFFRRRRRPE